ncbi:MAG: HNH endonuclease [Sulfuritalea sp.]|nr:HNH endonuclease [Sulfuritalea sp.]
MPIDALEQIELLTSADYVGALKRIEPTESQLEMLRVHLAAPDHTITARHLALALGFANWRAAILFYGKFAGNICNELSVSPTTKLAVLARPNKSPTLEYELCLRPSVIEALSELGIEGQDTWSFQEELGIEKPLVEGASFTVQVSAFERNPVARQRCIAHYGTGCSVCGFSFGATYGGSAKNYIHVHHLKPLASIGEEYVIDPIKDLRPVCANCHAVIHLRQPPYSIEEVKGMLCGDSNA